MAFKAIASKTWTNTEARGSTTKEFLPRFLRSRVVEPPSFEDPEDHQDEDRGTFTDREGSSPTAYDEQAPLLERDPRRGRFGTSQGPGGMFWRGEELDGQQSFWSHDSSDFEDEDESRGCFAGFLRLVARVMKKFGFMTE